MLTLALLAFRNLFRARARTALTLGALLFGVMMSVALSGFLFGLAEALVTETIETRVGAIQVHRRGYFENRDRQPLGLDL
jgi:putative ABC transport system permease protein